MVSSMGAQGVPETIDGLGPNPESCGRRVTPVADQMVAARLQSHMQRITSNRAPGALPNQQATLAAVLAKSDQQYGPMVEINETTGDNSDDARVPLGVRQHERRRLIHVEVPDHLPGLRQHAALYLLP